MAAERAWSEEDSRTFIQYADYFVPERKQQMQIICQLLSSAPTLHQVVDLGCGEGVLCEAILQQFPACQVTGFEGSQEMLQQANKRLASWPDRFHLQPFRLSHTSWRHFDEPVHAFVSSLVIHHLNADEKKQLYQDLYRLLAKEGILVVADIIRPTTAVGFQVAAKAWDTYLEQEAPSEACHYFHEQGWNYFQYPHDPVDQPSALYEQLNWLTQIGFQHVDVFWLQAGHAIFAGWKK